MASGAHGNLSIKDLYTPESLQIIIGPDKRPFSVPRGLICAKSDYFNKAFQRHFQEGQQRAITLVDVKEWIFECFVGWLYTGRIFWEPVDELNDDGPTPCSDSDAEDLVAAAEMEDENDRHEPTTWEHEHLIDLYIFGDRYDTRGFRNDTIMAFQLKSLQKLPRRYRWPCDTDSCKIFEDLPESAALHRFMLDAHVFAMNPDPLDTTDDVLSFPPQTLSRMANKAMQLARCRNCKKCQNGQPCNAKSHPNVKRFKPDYHYDVCSYHEHETEDERDSCKARWNILNAEHNLGLKKQ